MVVEPVPVHADAVVAGGFGLEVDALGAGRLLAGAEGVLLSLVALAVAAIFVVPAGLNVTGGECGAATAGAEEALCSGGDCDCCTSTFDEPLLQPATVSSKVSPAAIVPVFHMPVLTARARKRFSAAGRQDHMDVVREISSALSGSRGNDFHVIMPGTVGGDAGRRHRLVLSCAS